MTVKIERSVPAQIDVDGHLIRTRTLAGTVAGLLGQERIALVGRDQVIPGLAEPIRANTTVRVSRVREEYVVDFETIPFDTIWVPDPEVEIDNIRLVQEGQPGLTKRRYRVVYENGQEVRRSLEDIWAAQPPITKTMAYGTKIVVRTLDTPEGPIEYWRKMRVYTTSYKPASCGKPKSHPRYGYTRLGWKLQKGIVAVDPSVIPLRTKLYVPGYGLARAGDTGGAVKGKFVDLGFGDDDYESWHWWTDVYLLAPAPPRDKIRWVLPNWPRYPDRRR
jgi:3D (Asp-Asp-Asp) domain-containing protein